MIRYPMLVPGSHPIATEILNQPVYVETRLMGPQVGFAVRKKQLWVDMPVEAVALLNDKELNPTYQYVGALLEEPLRIVLTQIISRKGPLDHETKFIEADRIGMELVQLLHAGAVTEPQQLHDFLQQSPDGITLSPIDTPQGGRGPFLCVEITADMFGPPTTGDADGSQAPADAPAENLVTLE